MRRTPKLALAVALLLASAHSYANAGLPMLALAWPAQWLGFIPIVLIESEVIRRALKLPFRRVVIPVAKANLLSTLVGIPLAWAAMLVLELIVGGGLSLLPDAVGYSKYIQYVLFPFMVAWVGDNWWQIFFAFEILIVPFCVVSIFFEERVLRRALPEQSASFVHAFTRRANIVSYGLLALLAPLYPLLVHSE